MSTAKKPLKKSLEKLSLDNGREIIVYNDDSNPCERIEIRGQQGVELTIQMTEAGPVVQLNGANIQIHAAESINMTCKEFSVQASEQLELCSKGNVELKADGETHLDSTADTFVRAKTIWLN